MRALPQMLLLLSAAELPLPLPPCCLSRRYAICHYADA